ncbi:MAG TPA: hypothetical protein VE843_01230, partial [Ktedonobacteraceae bacterium]|nr:hypothetical protein [Ktedonobacteraceae bacterium]
MNDKVPQADPEADPEHEQQGYLGITPAPGVLPKKGRRAWIDRPEQLLQAVHALKASNVVAVDAEFTQVRSTVQT